ncbi:hypothetical protein G9H62_08205 [Aquirufa ecclesiirivi]|uniref:hypothetical protein n=1 Tax=Aquirufa ecclesiirivi TaxID=2715124 RepID=UPI0022A873AD|nr:hypothetical protein [Aquirufa ecclesiirivi]MCZ2472818.1 hypothetical protein [Aquirufa ecclesiirivi]
MKNNLSSLQSDKTDSQLSKEKKNWIEPQIIIWEYVNLGLKYGVGADGGGKSYNIT